jgi:hypothetical protein
VVKVNVEGGEIKDWARVDEKRAVIETGERDYWLLDVDTLEFK